MSANKEPELAPKFQGTAGLSVVSTLHPPPSTPAFRLTRHVHRNGQVTSTLHGQSANDKDYEVTN